MYAYARTHTHTQTHTRTGEDAHVTHALVVQARQVDGHVLVVPHSPPLKQLPVAVLVHLEHNLRVFGSGVVRVWAI